MLNEQLEQQFNAQTGIPQPEVKEVKQRNTSNIVRYYKTSDGLHEFPITDKKGFQAYEKQLKINQKLLEFSVKYLGNKDESIIFANILRDNQEELKQILK